MEKIQRTISFTKELIRLVEEYQIKELKETQVKPTFSDACCKLIFFGLREKEITN